MALRLLFLHIKFMCWLHCLKCLNTVVIILSTMEVIWQLWLLTSSKIWHYVILWVCKDGIAITIKKNAKMDFISKLFQSPLSTCKVIYSFFWIEILKENFGWHINQTSATGKLNVGSEYSIVSHKSYSRMCPRPLAKEYGFYAVLVWKRVKTLSILVWNRVQWFLRELRARMNVFVVSIPNEWEGARVRCKLEMDFKKSFSGMTF